jgi:hypothetical protein
MIKLTGTIVNTERNLVGFMITGTDKDFGGYASTSTITKSESIASLIQRKFQNSQIAVVNGKIVEKGNFKIHDLPMALLNKRGNEYSFIPVGNKMILTQRYMENDENIGFRVKFEDGSEDNITYTNVLVLSKWFKPGNFVIRSLSNGKQFIAGKPSVLTLNDLPAVDMSTRQPKSQEESAKRTKSGAKHTENKINGSVETGFDILDLYDFIETNGGCTIYLPTEKYEAATKGGNAKAENFTSLGIGEVATSKPDYSSSKINVNNSFKKVGIVPVEINGINQNIVTYIHRTKSVFLRGENYIKKFGIAIPVDKEQELVKFFGRSLALEKITDPSVTNPLGQVINSKGLVFYKIDASKLDLLSANKRKESIKTVEQLSQMCEALNTYKLISKAMGPRGGIMKMVKDELGEVALNNELERKPFGIFSAMNENALNAIANAGIDIYTGSYTAPAVEGKDASADKAKNKKTLASTDEDESVEITYVLGGLTDMTGAKIVETVQYGNKAGKLPKEVCDSVNQILSIEFGAKRYEAAKKVYDIVNKNIDKLNKDFWKHNAAMFIEGNKVKVHTHDSSEWEYTENTKVKTAKVYRCTKAGFENLEVRLKGTEI